jgi:iron complex transport system substrate-binding protein
LVATAAITLSACSSNGAAPATQTNGNGSFPVTVTSGTGRVEIRSRPARIISLSASATQMLYAIGAGPQVVAVDQYSTIPARAPRTSLTGYETSAESYLPYHPDLVVLAFEQAPTVVSQLASLGIPTLLLPPATTLAGSYQQYTALGEATGHQSAAAAEVSHVKAQLAQIVSSVGGRARGRTYYQEVDPTLYTATSHTFIGALYSLLGMRNVADAAGSAAGGYPQLSAEFLLRANPDYVFLADVDCCGQTAATFAQRPGFSGLRAVTSHHVYAVHDAIASEWGPSIVTFLQTVAGDVRRGQGS